MYGIVQDLALALDADPGAAGAVEELGVRYRELKAALEAGDEEAVERRWADLQRWVGSERAISVPKGLKWLIATAGIGVKGVVDSLDRLQTVVDFIDDPRLRALVQKALDLW